MIRRSMRNERGIILDWLVKVGIWLALISVVLFDGGAIAVNAISLNSTANDLAIQLATKVGEGTAETPKELEDAAKLATKEAGVKLVSVGLDDTGILHIKIRRTASTLIVGRISAIEDWAVATGDAQSDVR